MQRRGVSDSRTDTDKEREKRRIAWMIQQQKEREHERLKKQKIEEYERRRAEELGLNRKRRSHRRSRSETRSRSRSEESHHRSGRSKTETSRPQTKIDKHNSSDNHKSLFKGPKEAPKIDPNDLHKITVKIVRKIPTTTVETNEIRRDVLSHEEITLKRREGEGLKPVFDREELKQCEAKPIEEHRTIEVIGKPCSVKRLDSKRRSSSYSPRRRRSHSPHLHSSSRTFSHRSRHDEHSKYQQEDRHHKDYRTEKRHSNTRESSREDLRRHKISARRSHSRDRDYHKSERDHTRSSRSEKEYREHRGRSKERFYERHEERDSSRERRLPPPPFYDQMPYPLYYGGFAPRPMIVGPSLPPIRGPMPRGRLPINPVRPPYPPRFIGPQDMYRAVLPPDPRFGRMY